MCKKAVLLITVIISVVMLVLYNENKPLGEVDVINVQKGVFHDIITVVMNEDHLNNLSDDSDSITVKNGERIAVFKRKEMLTNFYILKRDYGIDDLSCYYSGRINGDRYYLLELYVTTNKDNKEGKYFVYEAKDVVKKTQVYRLSENPLSPFRLFYVLGLSFLIITLVMVLWLIFESSQ